MAKLKVGFVGTGDPLGLIRGLSSRLEVVAKTLDFELVAYGEGVSDRDQAQTAADYFRKMKVDIVLMQCQGFTWFGETILPFTEIEAVLAIWAIPEPKSQGPLPLNSLTGINLFSSVLNARFAESKIKFKWLYGDTDSPFFLDRLRVTLQATAAIKALKGSKIAIVGGVAEGFVNLEYDKSSVEKIFGVTIEEVDIHELFKLCKNQSDKQKTALVQELKLGAVSCSADPDRLETSAAVILSIEEIAKKNGYAGLAIACWTAFQSELDIFPCLAFGHLCDKGLPIACEGDLMGLLSMMTIDAMAGDRSALMDMVQLDNERENIMWWHCGIGLPSYSGEEGYILREYPVMPGMPADPGVTVDMVFRPNPVTVMRLNKNGSEMLALSADIVPGADNGFDGVRGWFGNLSMDNQKVKPIELFETIVRNGIPHHYAFIKGSVEDALREFAYLKDIKVIEKSDYKVYNY